MNDEMASFGVRARVLRQVGHALWPIGNSKNALGAHGDS